MTNAPFNYRLTISPVEKSDQTARLYLTPLSGMDRKEFLAFEYVYTKTSDGRTACSAAIG
jgi:hypothetical protein